MKILATLILAPGLALAQTLTPPTPVPIPKSLPTQVSAFTPKTASSSSASAPSEASPQGAPTLQDQMVITQDDIGSANLLLVPQTQSRKSLGEILGQVYGTLHTEIEREIAAEAAQVHLDKDQYIKSPQSYANFIRMMTTTDLNKATPLNRDIAIFKMEFRRRIQNSVISNSDRRMKNENVIVRNYLRPWVNQMGLSSTPFFEDYKE